MVRSRNKVSFQNRWNPRRPAPGTRHLTFEPLEARHVLTTFTVTSLADFPVSGPGSAPGTLRQAVFDANQSSNADVIQFAANLNGTINLSIAEDNFWGASALVIASPVTIRGNANGITISRNTSANEMRLFHVTTTGTLTLESISLTEGLARGLAGEGPELPGGEGRGGAVYNEGSLTVLASTLYGNHAIGGNAGNGGAAGGARGGAIFSEQGSLTVSNTTLSGNSTQSGGGSVSNFGGAIYAVNGTVSIRNSTITENIATSGRGMYVLGKTGMTTVDITSTIIGQHDAPLTILDLNIPFDAGGQVQVTGSNNLIRRQNDYGYIAVSADDPLLAPLANNGGPTMTHALNPSSPAINLGSNPAGLVTDQRGSTFSRLAGIAVDIGAFELQTVANPALLGDYNLNRSVDAADYVLWRKTMGSTVAQYDGADGNGNGSVDVADFGVWRANFGATSTASGTAIQKSSGTYRDTIAQANSSQDNDFAVSHVSTSLAFAEHRPQRAVSHIEAILRQAGPLRVTLDESSKLLFVVASPKTCPNFKFGCATTSASRDASDQQPTLGGSLAALDAIFAQWPSVT